MGRVKEGEGEGEGKEGKKLLPSFLPLPHSHLLIWALAPFSSQAKHQKSRSSSFFAPKPHRNACYTGYDTR